MKYFDYAATTPLYSEVLEILLHSYKNDFANPNALHELGSNLRESLEEQRQSLKGLLRIRPSDSLYFTSCATESNNTVISGINFNGGDVLFYSKADHSSMTAVIEHLAAIKQIQLIELKNLDDGKICLADLKNKLADHAKKLKLVCLTSINNQSGAVIDIEEISKLIREYSKAHIHVDAVQHFGKLPLFNPSLVDSISLSAHKIGGPKGIGALYLKEKHNVKPFILGGGQEAGFRSGTESLPLIKAFVKASSLSLKDLKNKSETIYGLKINCKNALSEKIPEAIFPFENSSPYILSFILPGISSDIILRHLEMKKIYISTTSACSSKVKGFNPSLLALNIDEKFHKNFLRISFGPQTTQAEIDDLVDGFKAVWDELKKLKK